MKLKITLTKNNEYIGFRSFEKDSIAYIPKIAFFKVIDQYFASLKIYQIIIFKLTISIWFKGKQMQIFILD